MEVRVLTHKHLLKEQQAVMDLLDMAGGHRHIPIVLDMWETEPLNITRYSRVLTHHGSKASYLAL